MATTTILQRVCFLSLLMALLNMSGCCAGEGQLYTESEVGCGVKDPEAGEYQLKSSGWGKERISYKILNYPAYLAYNSVRKEIKKAFDLWAEKTNLSFREMVYGTEDWKKKADIKISFKSKTHNCSGEPFSETALAHAFSPENGGEIHFNTEFKFSIDYTDYNLLQVAAHEIGHSLGLDHSKEREAIMFQGYKKEEPRPLISDDDIKGIQALYEQKREPGTKTPIGYPYVSFPNKRCTLAHGTCSDDSQCCSDECKFKPYRDVGKCK